MISEASTGIYHPFAESDSEAPAETLQRQMAENGYLFFRGLAPAEDLLDVRRQALELCAAEGWLDPRRDLMDGIVREGMTPLTEGDPPYMVVYKKLLRLPDFHDLPAREYFLAVARKLLGPEVFVHPRRIGRMTFPQNVRATTPAHQDFFYIRGTVDTYSCWAPLGECPMTLGSLAVGRGSHRGGFIEHTEYTPGAVGGRGVNINELSIEWNASDFRLGDALFFHSHTIHKALPNLTADRLRLSTDNRYQRPHDAIDPGALRPHFNLD